MIYTSAACRIWLMLAPRVDSNGFVKRFMKMEVFQTDYACGSISAVACVSRMAVGIVLILDSIHAIWKT